LQMHDSTSLMKYIIPSSRRMLLDTFRKNNNVSVNIKSPMIKQKNIIKINKADSAQQK